MTDQPLNEENPKTVPYERFQEVIKEKNDYKAKYDEAIGKLSATEEERNKFKADYEKAERNSQLTTIATKYNLPPELATRLQGSTPEELAKDAEALAKLISAPNPGTRDVPRGVDGALVPKTHEEAVKEIFTNLRETKK